MQKSDEELAAAYAVKWLKMFIRQTETDSDGDHWKVLKAKLAEFDAVADAILGAKTWDVLDKCEYLATGDLPLQEVMVQ
jgi:hypothetical protein